MRKKQIKSNNFHIKKRKLRKTNEKKIAKIFLLSAIELNSATQRNKDDDDEKRITKSV